MFYHCESEEDMMRVKGTRGKGGLQGRPLRTLGKRTTPVSILDLGITKDQAAAVVEG